MSPAPVPDQVVRFQLFNGEIVPVELSLLYQYPESQLSQWALDVWNEDPEQSVYPLMDKDMFPLVLTFLRTKKVWLPKDCGITRESFFGYLEKLGPWPESLDTSQVSTYPSDLKEAAVLSETSCVVTDMSPCVEKYAQKETTPRINSKEEAKYKASAMFKFFSLDVTAYDVTREVLRRYLVDLSNSLVFSKTVKVQDYDVYMSLKRIKDGDMALGEACNGLLRMFGLKIESLETKLNPSVLIVGLGEVTEHLLEDSNCETETSSILAFIKEDAPAVKIAGQSLRAILKSDSSYCCYFDESQIHRVYTPRLLKKANQVIKRFGSIDIQSIERDGRIQVRWDEDYDETS